MQLLKQAESHHFIFCICFLRFCNQNWPITHVIYIVRLSWKQGLWSLFDSHKGSSNHGPKATTLVMALQNPDPISYRDWLWSDRGKVHRSLRCWFVWACADIKESMTRARWNAIALKTQPWCATMGAAQLSRRCDMKKSLRRKELHERMCLKKAQYVHASTGFQPF